MPLFKFIYIYIVSVFCVPLSLYTLQCNIISVYVHYMYLSIYLFTHIVMVQYVYVAFCITEHQCYLHGIVLLDISIFISSVLRDYRRD